MGAMTPFVLTAPNQFRPAGPPALDTPAFREALAAVEAIGGARSTLRTPAQTEIARYWSDAIGTYAPAGHWNAITATVLTPMRLGLDAEAQVFAELNVAMADAGIAIADAKYTYNVLASGDGDPAWRRRNETRSGWSPLLETPNHPSYISGHSGFSGAAAVVLTARFGARPFSFASASVPGVTRNSPVSSRRPRKRRSAGCSAAFISRSITWMACQPAARSAPGPCPRSAVWPRIEVR